MANLEAQTEEIEVLQSIYEGDTNFKSVDNHTFQYKFGTEGEKSTVLIEIQWPSDYPEILPTFSLAAFYNNHLTTAAKSALLNSLNEEAGNNLGCPQTYTIIEWARESFQEIIAPFLVEDVTPRIDNLSLEDKGTEEVAKVKVKKEQLTKSQKRREWNRVDATGERPRGYDWVDIVKHLSQIGSRDYSAPEVSQTPSQESYLASSNLPN